MNASTWSIKNPIPAILLFIMLAFAGGLAYRSLKVQQFPDVDLSTVNVTAQLPGAAPGQLETEVARKIENSVATLTGVKNIFAKLQDGIATVRVVFRLEKPMQEALDDVRDAVARVRSDLPPELRDPVIQRFNLSGMPILTYTVSSGHMDEEALSWFVDHTIAKRLLAIRGVGSVSRVGGVDREIRVELDPAKMLAIKATAADISQQLRRTQQEASGGRADIGGTQQSVRTLGTVPTAAALATVSITLTNGQRVKLEDVATVADTIAERRSAAFLNGRTVVGFEIVRSRGASEVEVAAAVRKELAAMQNEQQDLAVAEAFDSVDIVAENLRGSLSLLFEGGLLAVAVVWLFLRDWRATAVAAIALPLSIIPAFAAMYCFGFSINVVTLLSLSLVVGVLVDDAIVEIENIVRHMRMGKSPYQAALEAADEIGMAVIATTFTLIAVFLPTAFMPGIPGKFFVQFGWTASIAVFFSLVVARLLTPMMCAYLLHKPGHSVVEPRWLVEYQQWARWCLRHRIKTLLATVVFVCGSLAPLFMGAINGGFIPPADPAQTQVNLTLPPGSTLQQTIALAERARLLLQDHPQVQSIFTAIGAGATGSDPFASLAVPEPRRAALTLRLAPRNERPGISQQVIERQLQASLQNLAGVRVAVGLPANSSRFDLALVGEDAQALRNHARLVERDLRTIPGIGSVTPSSDSARPELVVRPDFSRMAELGVSSRVIADTLRVATAGDYDQGLAKFNLTDRQVPIVVALPPRAREDLALLRQLTVPGKFGAVAIGNVADVALDSGPAAIDRLDRARSVIFSVELQGQPLNLVQSRALALPSLRDLPKGMYLRALGDAEGNKEMQEGFSLAMASGILCIYFVLVLLFKGFIQPLTILWALILSVPGAFLALFLTGTDISMPAMIGLVMLMGIATKNSILLIDYVLLARREHGLSREEAVIDACHKRARPIVMTTIAMGAGMLPVALGMGTDPSFRAPMAIVVIGGLLTSTFLSLLVIPVIFTYVDDMVLKLRRLLPLHARVNTTKPDLTVTH